MADSNQEYSTIIGADATFKGDLSFESAAKVVGRFEGSITAKGKVHIADGANCKAMVSAKEVSVEGHVEGNVEARDRLDVRNNGMITGDIVAAKMSMAEGASIDGHCRIGAANGAKRPTSTEVKPAAQAQARSAPG